ncbi:MAG: hypothetical protein KAY46_03915 [Burkholderiaceae bacterium]|nr:hypothetical protein [Burkholderiaceae bacterium]
MDQPKTGEMILLKDGKLDAEAIDAYADALHAELRKFDKETLAMHLALEIVSHELTRQIHELGDPHGTQFERIARAALNQLDAGRDDRMLGIRHRANQRWRRKDRPSSDPYDQSRNARLRTFHARLLADGARDATTQTATEFDLSARQVRNILKG